MAIQLKDRILTLCTTVGTNDAIVGATKEGYQGWEGITYGNTVYYCITDYEAWEVGYGNYMNRWFNTRQYQELCYPHLMLMQS